MDLKSNLKKVIKHFCHDGTSKLCRYVTSRGVMWRYIIAKGIGYDLRQIKRKAVKSVHKWTM